MRIVTQMKVLFVMFLILSGTLAVALSDGTEYHMHTQYSFNFPVADPVGGASRSFVFILRADAKNPGFTKEDEEEIRKLLENELSKTDVFPLLVSGKSEGCDSYDRKLLHETLSSKVLRLNEKIYRLRIACDLSNRRRKSEF